MTQSTHKAPRQGEDDSIAMPPLDEDFDAYEVVSLARENSSVFENSEKETKEREREVIAKQESRVVFVLRMVVLLVLVASAVGVSYGVYMYTNGQEEDAFETQFDADATKVLESIGTTMEQTLGSTDAFITQLVAYARYSNSQGWPFVTMPSFAIHATKLLKLSKAFYFTVYPFVEPWQRDDWQKYANESNGWIYESLEIQASDEDWHGVPETEFGASYEIYSGRDRDHSEPYEYMNNFLPSWQVHPMVPSATPSAYNYDIWQIEALAEGILHADEFKRVVVSPHVNAVWDPTSEESIDLAKRQSDWAANYASPDIDTSEPFSVITFPIYDSLETVRLDLTKNHTFVGILTFSLFWRELIKNVLPEGHEGVILVFSDPCSPAFTYRLDGPRVTYLGQGDLHDPAFDGMEHTATLPDMASPKENGGDSSSYTGLPISESYCPRTISVYPSTDMEDDHTSMDPIIFTLVAASIFLFTSAVFIVYDCWVNRRQRITMQRALASGAIVSSLFPTNVKEKLYEEQQHEQEKQLALKQFEYGKQRDSEEAGRPIADYFENTTIFFADLVGFTSWSSSRKPEQVFELLETIYGCFDVIANRRRVFKVETIGDCYVAVTGIPEPQKHHAAIMARFARDCMTALHEVTHDMCDRLGDDTKNLAMRCGLHSGSVTAGVLRGEKGRFQLFGDSVNTAARMEQTGQPGKIHVSEGFAEALQASGKQHWLRHREDKVHAKGLGELSTYWVVMRGMEDAMTSSGASSVEDFNLSTEDDLLASSRNSDGTSSSSDLQFDAEVEI